MRHKVRHIELSPHGIWYFRMRVPPALHAAMQRSEVRHSLLTGNLREAAKRAAHYVVHYHALFDKHNAMQYKPDLANAAKFEVTFHESGRPASVKTDGSEKDNSAALEALKIIATAPAAQDVPPAISSSPLLSDLIKRFLDEMFAPLPSTGRPRKAWNTEKARQERPHHLAVLRELTGDVPIRKLTRGEVRGAWSNLLVLPPNLHKSPRWRGKSIREVVSQQSAQLRKFDNLLKQTPPEQRATLDRDAYAKVLSGSTANNYAWTWSAFFEWCLHENIIDANPALGLQVERDKTRTTRRPFEPEEIKRIFESNYYRNAEYDKPSKYFVPLLLLYTGGRLNEFCQLVVDDIVRVGDIDCIKIYDSDADRQQLKNSQSRRLIPIHPKIIECGFLDYVDGMRKRKRTWKLFPELDSGDEKHSKYLGNWHGRFLRSVGVKAGRGIDAHSYRHNAIRVWMNAGVEERYVSAICGQGYGNSGGETAEPLKAEKGVAFKVYGGLFDPTVLRPYIEMLDYGIEHTPYKKP